MNLSSKNLKNRKIAIIGAFSALVILMGIPGLHLGLIQISPTVSLTIMHIPVALAAILGGLSGGIITGAIFGITSLINAAVNPSGVLDPLFLNPLCSVLPRVLYGIFVWAIFKLLNMIPKFPKTINAGISAFISSLFHTTVVIGCLYIFANGEIVKAMNGSGYFVVMGLLLPGASMEALASTIISVAVSSVIFITGKSKAKLLEENTEDEEENK